MRKREENKKREKEEVFAFGLVICGGLRYIWMIKRAHTHTQTHSLYDNYTQNNYFFFYYLVCVNFINYKWTQTHTHTHTHGYKIIFEYLHCVC
jgi:hypothetical protein